MLRQDLKIELLGSSCSTSGATETLAAARTSTSHLIQVSLRLEEPPGVSRVCLQIPHHGLRPEFSRVVAAHGDSILIQVSIQQTDSPNRTEDHFVYSAGAAGADPPWPPSMSLLPSFHVGCTAGLARRGKDLIVAARLEGVSAGPDTPELMGEANLSLYRSGEWSMKRVQIRFCDASEVLEKIPSLWDAIVPVSDGLLCWVDYSYHLGVLLGDVFEETPRLQYLPLPRENICGERSNRNVCASAGGDALKFVNIFPRCCCGGAGASNCQRSCHAYTIETWTMRIGKDDMEWVKDAIVDSTELWALDSYNGLRCFPLNHPVVSLEEPEVICFWLHKPRVDGYWNYNDDKTVDVVMVNMRSKTIHSVSSCEDGLLSLSGMHDRLFTSNVSYFFNSCQRSGSGATFRGQRPEDIDRPPPGIRDDIARNQPMLSDPSVQASEIFEVFQEIPNYVMDDDEVKAYRILRRDNCRGFRSLLGLPKNLRKDWLLMELKASED